MLQQCQEREIRWDKKGNRGYTLFMKNHKRELSFDGKSEGSIKYYYKAVKIEIITDVDYLHDT